MSHRNGCRIALASFALACLLGSALPARAEGEPAAAASASAVKGEILMWIDDAKDKLIELAEAFPESKYGWSPDKGVRTVGEVFMHVSAANYGIPSFIGVTPPAGFSFATYEHSLTKKADIVKSLKDSFAHAEGALTAASDADMNKLAEFFGMKTTARGAYMLLLSHAHEHLGQAIAYARSNKLTPPWTAREAAAAAAAAKEKKK